MNIYTATLTIFLTFLAVFLVSGWLVSRPPRIPLDRLADPRPLPGELPIAGRLPVYETGPPWHGAGVGLELVESFDPFDTAPLLLLSRAAAQIQSHDRDNRARISETDWLIEAGEREIGPVP